MTSNNDNKFKYNAKELEDDHNLYWYHYGARFYDPQLGRWHTVDPVDEFHSTYQYGPNNPINGIDPDGLKWTTTNIGTEYEDIVWIEDPGFSISPDGTMSPSNMG